MLRHRLAPAILLVGLVVLVFGRTVANGWVEFDDLTHVVENPNLTPVTWGRIAGLWSAAYECLYIPVSYTLYAAEAVAARWLAAAAPTAPPAPWLFHLVSLVLHAAATLVVRRILLVCCGHPWAATAGAVVFAVHPLQVESVAWISEQRGLLAGLLGLVAIDRFLDWNARSADDHRAWRDYGIGLGALILALLAKPSSVVVPVVALCLAHDHSQRTRSAMIVALAPWFACSGAIAVLTRLVQPADLTTASVFPAARLLVAADAIGFYAAKLVMPWNLCVAYGRTPQVVLADPATPWIAAAVAAALAAIAILPALRAWRLPTLLFLLPLTPVLGLVPFVFQNQSTVADRYAYLSMLGPALAVARWLGKADAAARLPRLAALALIACLAALACRQAGFWRNTGTLAAHAVAVAPGVSGSWTLLAAHQIIAGDPQAAVESARRAIEIAPRNRIAWLNLASGLSRLQHARGADDAFARLRQLGMSDAELATIFYNRGCTALREGNDAVAAGDFQLALDRDPRHQRAAANLGVALTRLGAVEPAVEVLRSRLAVAPDDATAWVGLGNALLVAGRHAEAAECYGSALALDPNDAPTLLNRAVARIGAGDGAGAAADAAAATALGAAPDPELLERLERLTTR